MSNHILTVNVGHNVGDHRDALNQAQIVSCVHGVLGFDGATISTCTGFWQGTYETSTQIVIAGLSLSDALRMYDLLPIVAAELNQWSVFGTITHADRCGECLASAEPLNAWRRVC